MTHVTKQHLQPLQVLALSLLFRNLTHPPLLCEMLSLSGYQMLGLVLRSPSAVRSAQILKVLQNISLKSCWSLLTLTLFAVSIPVISTFVTLLVDDPHHLNMGWGNRINAS